MTDKDWSQSYSGLPEKLFYNYISLKWDMEATLKKFLNKKEKLLQNLFAILSIQEDLRNNNKIKTRMIIATIY